MKSCLSYRPVSRLFSLLVLGLLVSAAGVCAEVTTPEQFFGFKLGTDKKLARYDKIVEYLQKIAGQSDRVRVRNLGPTTLGNPYLLVEISSPENLKDLDHYKSLERKLYFQGGAPTEAERDEIFNSGKAVVLVTNNLHSNEIGSSQAIVELIHRLATDNSDGVKKILDNVVFLTVPSANPDGQILVTDWYNKVVDTPNESSPLPVLYHYYVGHDDNRDMFLFSQKESALAAGILWHDWFPSVWLDEHQQGSNASRIFTMPARDPINPNVDPLIYRWETILGISQSAALDAEGKTGVIHNVSYDSYYVGAFGWTGWWHNQVGMLTEVASARLASPIYQQRATLSLSSSAAAPGGGSAGGGRGTGAGRGAGGGRAAAPAAPGGDAAPGAGGGFGDGRAGTQEQPLPAPTDITPRNDYLQPWLGGKWTLGDIVDYEVTATYALLETAADRRETLLRDIYKVNLDTIEKGRKGELGRGSEKTYGVLIPVSEQHDPAEAAELVDKLIGGGVEVYRAKNEFKQDGKTYAAGTFVVPFTQVFARYAKDLLERQTYPQVRVTPESDPIAPYDVSSWSLGLQFGLRTDFAKTALDSSLALERVTATPKWPLAAQSSGNGWSFAYTGAQSALLVNRLLKGGAAVRLTKPDSAGIPTALVTAKPETWTKAVEGFDIGAGAATGKTPPRPAVATTLRAPRIGLYQPWGGNQDEGWTRWLLEHYAFDYTTLHNKDVQAGKLRQRFDAIILPSQRGAALLTGNTSPSVLPEYRGGIGDDGWQALVDFTAEGGTIIALGESTNVLIEKLPLGVKNLKRTLTSQEHHAPGTIVNLQVDTSHPVGLGAARETFGFYINSPFFETVEGFSSQKVSVVARYPNTTVLASGWLRGDELMQGRAAVVAIDENPGKIVLFGIQPQNRAQTHATLPLLFNALYWSAEGDVNIAGQ
jgi:hypothetical protein